MDEEIKLAAVPAEPRFSLKQRIALWVVPWLTRALLTLLGSTLRFEHSWEGDPPLPEDTDMPPRGTIVPFWHGCILPAAYYFRGRDIAIMVSNSFDGELITRVVNRLDFRAIRGSSTHGGARALEGMEEQAAQGVLTSFTADGPKGPRFVAKYGPLLLARSTQRPIYCFYLAPRRAWQLNTWDRLLIPKPFTKVHLRWSKRIDVAADASREEFATSYGEMQAALEGVRLEAERRARSE
ncbi:MAG: lysophospholipid acyltransferase family protein [Candidatus Korobacteraceae bacterium]|jgi:lysophospholipid acyltransferase (LPLAT)-like uncharacterized protein